MSIKYLIASLILICTQEVFAGVTITGTRIIFPSDQQSVTVQLNNPVETPALIQSWLDDGDPSSIPEADKIPFILTPPLTQIEAKKGQMIRIIVKDTTGLPTDRESLYWFNILDIPPTDNEKIQDNKLQVSIRSRIKLFYRPTTLKMTQNKAFESLKFNYNTSDNMVTVQNASPYYMSFYDLRLVSEQQESIYDVPFMVAPYSSGRFKSNAKFKPKKIKYSLINDYGANQEFTVNL